MLVWCERLDITCGTVKCSEVCAIMGLPLGALVLMVFVAPSECSPAESATTASFW